MLFKWQAIDSRGKLAQGEMEASGKDQVVSFLKRQNFFVVSVNESKPTSKFKRLTAGLLGRVPIIDKIIFTEHLATMIKAGISLNDAFDVLADDTKNKILKKVVADLKTGLENGQSISSVLKRYRMIFSQYYINMVKSGEETGELGESLKKLTDFLRRDYSLVSKVKGALTYPAVLLISTFAVIALMVVFVLPRLVNLFTQSGVKLPLFTKIIIAVSLIISKNLILFIVLGIFSIFAFIVALRQESVRNFIASVSLKIPKVNKLVQDVQLARFARTLGSTVSAGIPIMDAIELTADTLNSVYKKSLLNSLSDVSKGISLSRVLKNRNDLFPNIVIGMINVGEKTGNLSELLSEMAGFYEEEVDNTLKELTTLIEPIMMVIMGVGIGGIALAIITPIYQLISKVS